ncbi:uncharacterized protein LOC126894718 [Daktulosphaira vitifoliae]|uniref:uncharacterized protein LOC126894718 n=1 Tax=Daktulosphaira vitifoliae TaxID=58002 RepID=UPI0021A9C820|nr:uncharacterized protein LOC126894718 [Daktulosphaira vitifoliae]
MAKISDRINKVEAFDSRIRRTEKRIEKIENNPINNKIDDSLDLLENLKIIFEKKPKDLRFNVFVKKYLSAESLSWWNINENERNEDTDLDQWKSFAENFKIKFWNKEYTQIVNKELTSKSMKPSELNYTTTEKELLAVIHVKRRFYEMIAGYQIILITDHRALLFLNSCKNPTKRIARWLLYLQPLNIKIEYISGLENVIPDTLSSNSPNRDEAENFEKAFK